MSAPKTPSADDSVSRWNRRIIATLAVGFVVMSAGVFLDTGVQQEAATFSPEGVSGKRIWLRENCMVCHQFYGMGGYLGPDLTNVISRLGSETTAWVIRNGRGSMPDLNLPEEDIRSLTIFLEEMGETGTFPQKTWPPGWFPPVHQPLPGS